VIGGNACRQAGAGADLGATGAMMALLSEAVLPTWCRPQKHCRHGAYRAVWQHCAWDQQCDLSQYGIRLADYVVNEAGFAPILARKSILIFVMRSSGIAPACAVLVTTVQSLRNQGEGDLDRGAPNLVRQFRISNNLAYPPL